MNNTWIIHLLMLSPVFRRWKKNTPRKKKKNQRTAGVTDFLLKFPKEFKFLTCVFQILIQVGTKVRFMPPLALALCSSQGNRLSSICLNTTLKLDI